MPPISITVLTLKPTRLLRLEGARARGERAKGKGEILISNLFLLTTFSLGTGSHFSVALLCTCTLVAACLRTPLRRVQNTPKHHALAVG
jgi:hypothetical protein